MNTQEQTRANTKMHTRVDKQSIQVEGKRKDKQQLKNQKKDEGKQKTAMIR